MAGAQTVGFFGRVAAGASRVLSALGWIGLVVSLGQILVVLAKSVINMFKEVDVVSKALNKTVDESITTIQLSMKS